MQYRRPGILTSALSALLLVTVALTVSCSAQTEDQAARIASSNDARRQIAA